MNPALQHIRALPDHLINQIAAGEVVERPASIVKELMENSLDAGASTVRVEVRGGGADSLSVADDGHGIARDELALAMTRHCTSKINRTEDLSALLSLGFRGEALASIAAAAEVSLTSRVSDSSHAWAMHTQPGQAMPLPVPASRSQGTTVMVRKLFATLPARRQFLRRATTETLVIQQLLRGLAFCVPAVGFSLSFEDRRQWQAVAARDDRSAAQRWRAVFGAEFAREARFIERMAGDMRVFGWVGPPEFARAQSDLQFLAVNGRLVRDRQLAHGIRMAFGDSLPAGRYPGFALHLELPPSEVDVNVHPGKTEVRFRHLREVHDLFFSATREALRRVAVPVLQPAATVAVSPARTAGISPLRAYPLSRGPTVGDDFSDGSGAFKSVVSQVGDRPVGPPAGPRLIGGRYLPVVENGGALCIHDLVALLESALGLDAVVSRQTLTFPVRVPAPPGPTAGLLLTDLLEFEVEFAPIGPTTWVLRALPGWLPAVDAEVLVRELMQDDAFPENARAALARAIARALDLPANVEARGAWLEAWTQRLPGLDLSVFSSRPSAEELAALFPRQRRES